MTFLLQTRALERYSEIQKNIIKKGFDESSTLNTYQVCQEHGRF